MNYILYDVEATCWEDKRSMRDKKREAIEIGGLKMNAEGEVLGRFSQFIRPTIWPELSKFCKELTHISQEDVDSAASFSDVIKEFQTWIGVEEEEYLLCSWGFFDKSILRKNCEHYSLDSAWTKKHISLKHQYPRFYNMGYAPGLLRALEKEGFDFEGEQHRALTDAENMAKIFRKHFNLWRY